ncbi:hypothetical protein os1_31000 [Comamonadaceae bacterium OS-1]|nr:hypothetical protein os1_31000 [Comamonadaceae bacterium OS-1]
MTVSFQRIAAIALVALATGPLFTASSMAATDAVVVASAASTSASANGDKALASAVANAISQSMGSQVKNVAVSSNDGTVTLSGWITGPDQESQVRHIAANVPGTTRVYSRLRTWSSETIH